MCRDYYDDMVDNKYEVSTAELRHQLSERLQHEVGFHYDMLDFIDVLEFGARKYAKGNWLQADGVKADLKTNSDSMFHHLAESLCGRRSDEESGLDPLLHLATRALMAYVRIKNKIGNN